MKFHKLLKFSRIFLQYCAKQGYQLVGYNFILSQRCNFAVWHYWKISCWVLKTGGSPNGKPPVKGGQNEAL